MTVKLRFTAQLKDAAGVGSDQMELLEKEKIQSFLKRTVDKYGSTYGNILFDEKGKFRHSNLIVVNLVQANYDENILLNDGDELMVLSPVSGG